MATSWPCKSCGEECDSQFYCTRCFFDFLHDWRKQAEEQGDFPEDWRQADL